jgi:CDP-diacylglycerol---serine O-phosphatidyltransferase
MRPPFSNGERKPRRLRHVAVIPSLFTLANGVCGFAAIVVASRVPASHLDPSAGPAFDQAMQWLCIAGWLIFAGMIFDVLDGRVARLYGAASRFGAELDSMCDVVTFGVAPAFLLLKMGPTPFDHWIMYRILFVASTLYVVCTIVRLARFNVETPLDAESHRYFTGLPSPAAAGCLASVAVLRYELHTSGFPGFEPETLQRYLHWFAHVLPFLAAGIAVLMVSSYRYPHFVNQSLRGRRPFRILVTALLFVAAVAVALPGLALVLGFWLYAVVSFVRGVFGPPPPAPTAPPVLHPELRN